MPRIEVHLDEKKLLEGLVKEMVKLTQSLAYWLTKNHPDKVVLISFGHLDLFTDEMKKDYVEWCQTDEGKSYLQGGANYKEVEE